MGDTKGAMEMSVGTIVTIVLLMSVLILGLFLVRNIFSSASGAVDMTDQQLQAEIGKLFGAEDSKLAIYPSSKYLEIKTKNDDAIGIGIRNINNQFNTGTQFSYEVTYRENSCGMNQNQAMSLIVLGRTATLTIPEGGLRVDRIRFSVPEGVPNCIIRYEVTVKKDSALYGAESFEIKTKV